LAGDFHEKRSVSRENAVKMREESLAFVSDSGMGTMTEMGFQYVVPWSDIIIDMPLKNRGATILNYSVPFYQIALRGLVPYTGQAVNLAENYTANLLRTVESGAGLQFSFMTVPTAALQETMYRHFFANEYSRWIETADSLYQRFASDFDGLYEKGITDHIILSPGVTVTVYEGGTRVFVNSTDLLWNRDGVTVPPNDWKVVR
jgi:hypothetical protein